MRDRVDYIKTGALLTCWKKHKFLNEVSSVPLQQLGIEKSRGGSTPQYHPQC